jgi:hypothetical protein
MCLYGWLPTWTMYRYLEIENMKKHMILVPLIFYIEF